MCNCARPGCHLPATSSCSGCTIERYCSGSCQKGDWKAHKPMCPILKTLSNKLQPFHQAVKIILEILDSEKGSDGRVLKHLLTYADHQFGKDITGIGYRQREDGERIYNWQVDIDILQNINCSLLNSYSRDGSLCHIVCNDLMYPCLERSLEILSPWLALSDSKESNCITLLSGDLLNHLLDQLIRMEQNMAAITTDRRQSVAAEGHCQRCLAYSRRFGLEGEQKTTFIFAALRAYCQLRQQQNDYLDAVNFAEEGYNLVVTAYDPVHPEVQEAASVLINVLILKGDLYDAERYALVTYSNLRDKNNGMDQESEAVAKGTYNLAHTIYLQKGDLIKAEKLIREVLRIRTLIYDCYHHRIGMSCNLLVKILLEKNDLGEETKELQERCLVIAIKNDGPDGPRTASANRDLGIFYAKLARIQTTVNLKRSQLLLSKSHFAEASRIFSKTLGPTHPDAVNALSRLANITLMCQNHK